MLGEQTRHHHGLVETQAGGFVHGAGVTAGAAEVLLGTGDEESAALVEAGQPLALTVRNGVSGYAILSGIQILGSAPTPPVITGQLTLNDKLDHFSWSPIPSPRFVNVPIAIAIQALDATNGIFTNFTGTVFLNSFNGIRINPPITAAFVQGAWSGSITISQPATNLFLWASDRNGVQGRANAIDINNLPTLGFALSGNSMAIYWPAGSSNFVLETSASLSPAQWVQVAIPPFQIGNNYLLSIPMDNTNQFYRLHYTLP